MSESIPPFTDRAVDTSSEKASTARWFYNRTVGGTNVRLNEARTIDALYHEVRNHDIAITAYPRLSLALDGRVDRPQLGRVAATAHSHASGELVPIDRRQLFLTLIDETDLSFKQAERALEYCLHCWDWTGDPSTILEYPEFDTAATRRAVETLQTTDSSYWRLTDTTLPETTDVAVLGEATLSTDFCRKINWFCVG